jgi:hypothetical protein
MIKKLKMEKINLIQSKNKVSKKLLKIRRMNNQMTKWIMTLKVYI